MTIPINKGSADVYTDFGGLAALKKSVRSNDPDALRQVAKQYESLFTRMMIKSMRDAVGKDPIFGSDQEESYQGMYDDQLSIELSKGKGLGLADMLVQQMQRLSGGARSDTTSANAQDTNTALRLFKQNGPSSQPASVPVTSDTQASFVKDLWPAAQEAGQQLGVDPRNLIAQAALETNWGTHVPANNLFGVKAGKQWSGASVSAGTREYENGTTVSTTGQFRAYDSRAQSFQDYVSLLRNSPRYAAALNTGSNVHAFATALQRGGYATDPDYAAKISSIAGSISPQTATQEPSLKSASARPINSDSRYGAVRRWPMTGIL